MIKSAMAALDPKPDERIADLFCGLGNFTFPIATFGATVVSVEGERAMVKRLGEAAQSLALDQRIKAICADLFRIKSTQIISWGKMDKWLLDPPRAGAKELIQAMSSGSMPEKIVYVSCNPATLARDAALLVNKGYDVRSGQMIDMFPQTAHIESILLFERT